MDKGRLLSVYSKGQAIIWFHGLFGLFCLAIGAAAAACGFYPPLRRMGLTAGAAFLLLAAFFVKTAWDARQAAEYAAYENGIERMGTPPVFYPYQEIEDVFLFMTGKYRFGPNNVAFRRGPDDSWQWISAHLKGTLVLDDMLNQYVQKRAPLLLGQIKDGRKISFRYFESDQAGVDQFFSWDGRGFLRRTPKILALDQKNLIFNENAIPLSQLKPLLQLGADEFQIQRLDGQVVFSFQPTNVGSFDVFRRVFNQLVAR